MQFAKEEEGTASARNRKYRANFIANYKFQEGIAKGFGVGVGVRYRSKGAIGYQGKPNEFIQSLLASEPGVVITRPPRIQALVSSRLISPNPSMERRPMTSTVG